MLSSAFCSCCCWLSSRGQQVCQQKSSLEKQPPTYSIQLLSVREEGIPKELSGRDCWVAEGGIEGLVNGSVWWHTRGNAQRPTSRRGSDFIQSRINKQFEHTHTRARRHKKRLAFSHPFGSVVKWVRRKEPLIKGTASDRTGQDRTGVARPNMRGLLTLTRESMHTRRPKTNRRQEAQDEANARISFFSCPPPPAI